MKRLSLFLSLLFFLSACFKETPDPIKSAGKQRLWISNEGNFQWGNASLSLYDLASDELVSVDQFKQANGFPLGDVFQSITKHNKQFYLVVNNSGKVLICDENMKYEKSIDQLGSPRYIMPYGNNKALLSDLYSNTLRVLNLGDGSIAKTLTFPGWGEKLFSDGDQIWVCNLKSSKLFRFSTITEEISDSLDIGYAASAMVKDAQGHFWVLSKGDTSQQIKTRLSKLSLDGKSVEKHFEIAPTCSELAYDALSSQFFLMGQDLYTFSEANGISTQALVTANGRNFYALGLHGEELFIADAVDYVQKGHVFRYNLNGTLLGKFGVGPIPNGFLFDN